VGEAVKYKTFIRARDIRDVDAKHATERLGELAGQVFPVVISKEVPEGCYEYVELFYWDKEK
jgi:hypothetical protein